MIQHISSDPSAPAFRRSDVPALQHPNAPALRRSGAPALDFDLPPDLEAGEPPEARGLARDEVRLMVSRRADDQVSHARFRDLPRFLAPGDLLLINTSGTLNAALDATRADGTPLELHLSTRLPAGLWIVELRQPAGAATLPFRTASAGETLALPAGASVTLLTPYGGAASRKRWWADLRSRIGRTT